MLNRIEFHFEVTKCPAEDKTGSLLLLLDVECFGVAEHLGLKSTSMFDEAKAKLKNYFAITETFEKLRERLDLRCQEAGESIESFARDVKLIEHRVYSKAAYPVMLKHILIKKFTNGLNNELSRKRVILKAPKTFTEAAQYARFLRVSRSSCAHPLPPYRRHRVQSPASASEVVGQAVAVMGSRPAAGSNRHHVITTSEVVVEDAQQ